MNRVIDAFPAFMTYWAEVEHTSLDQQIASWPTSYLSQWPELLAKQIEDYSSQGLDWRQIARERVFPFLAEWLPAMEKAHRNLMELCMPVYSRAQEVLGFDCDAVFVIHVGIGCGAGWVTPFDGSPAILFGLENIAECGWSDPVTLEGVIAHETGHLVHYHWRAQEGRPVGAGPWWQLYEEGFAQRCESLILEAETWHQASRCDADGWLDWCESHQDWLAAEFLRIVDAAQPVTSLFGSWFDLCGKKETGYFLGYHVIRELEQHFGLRSIALLDHVEELSRPILERMAKAKDRALRVRT